MNPNALILAAAAIGMVVNTFAILGVAWRGGRLLGHMDGTIDRLSEEVRLLRVTRDEHATLLARAIQQLDDLEGRVTRAGF